MRVDLYRDESGFEALAGEWNRLVERGVSNVPFLRLEYQRSWWANRGGGEWPDGQLLIATGRDESGALIGIAPLFFVEHNRDGQPALLFVGSIEISDYLDLIVAPQHVAPFAAALLEALAPEKDTQGLPPWRVLDLYNIPQTSPGSQALLDAAAARGWQAARSPLQPCPVIPLPADWESYLAGIDKKQRHEIRRKLRRAEANNPPIAWHIVGPPADIEAEIGRFMEMMAHDPAKARFLTETMRSQFHDSVRAAHEHGWLQMAFLTVEGQPAAGYLNFDYGNRLWIYNSALDPAYNYLSSGWVLLSYLIQWAIEHGRRELDFMRGDEDYKFKFGGRPRQIYRVNLLR